MATIYDLTGANSEQDVGGVIFRWIDDPTATGSGVFPAFLVLSTLNGNDTDEEGFNTNFNGSNPSEVNWAQTSAIKVSDLPSVGDYYQIRLDLNESQAAISLTSFKIFQQATGDISSLTGLTHEKYSLDHTDDVTLSLTDHAAGGGKADYAILIPKSVFNGTDGDYVYIYARFTNADSGAEEFGLIKVEAPPPPGELSIIKDTVSNGTSVEGKNVLSGSDITWTYDVTATGGPVSGVTVTDDQLVTPTFVDGDTNSNSILDVGETWHYTATGEAIRGPYSNVGTASGTGVDSVSDPSSYTGVQASLHIEKLTNGSDDAGVMVGQSVTWTYAVTNTGDVAVDLNKAIGVVDDAGGPAPDFNPTYTGGDLNSDDKVDLTETWTFTTSGTATLGSYTNKATVTGSYTDDAHHTVYPSDSDTSHYDGFSGRALSQGFWSNKLDAWDGKSDALSKPTASAVASGVLNVLDGKIHDGGDIAGDATVVGTKYLLLGDTNGNGLQDDGGDYLYIDVKLAGAILSASTSGDARMIMLSQTIAAQLNIDNGTPAPNDIMQEAVHWLTNTDSWNFGGSGVNVDIIGGANHVVDVTAAGKLAGNPYSTNGVAWKMYVDVIDNSTSIVEWDNDTTVALNQQATGEGLKNALEAFNLAELVVSGNGPTAEVGWNTGTSVINDNPNTLDQFWVTLHLTHTLTGIA